MKPSPGSDNASVRIDAWLWAARFFKTRALAKHALDRGYVTRGGVACKPAHTLRVGDALRIERGEETFAIAVTALAAKRGSAALAQALYVECVESIAARAAARDRRRVERAGYQPPPKRPDKRSRRLLRALGDFDAR